MKTHNMIALVAALWCTGCAVTYAPTVPTNHHPAHPEASMAAVKAVHPLPGVGQDVPQQEATPATEAQPAHHHHGGQR